MPLSRKDASYLWDIVHAAKDIVEFTADTNIERFSQDKMCRYAVERQIAVLGEAAKRLSASFKEEHPDIPWEAIVAQRNVIAHEYGEIMVERVWRVATERVPELIDALETLLPRLEE